MTLPRHLGDRTVTASLVPLLGFKTSTAKSDCFKGGIQECAPDM